ncbi:MAG: Hpt domain-containing protein [Leptolyngbyaceae cyanobacterium]
MMIQDEELRTLYQTTGTERLQKIQAGLLQLEQASNPPSLLEELRRELHSLKGDSRSVGLDSIATLAQQIEDIVKALQKQELEFTLDLSDRLYQGLNTVSQLIQEATTDNPQEVDSQQTSYLLGTVLASALPATAAVESIAVQKTHLYIEDDELREIYFSTSEGRLHVIESHLKQLEEEATNTSTLEILRREIHSLKGDSKAVGLEEIAGLAQAIEDIIKDIQREFLSFTAQIGTGLHESIRAIRQLVYDATLGEPSAVDIEQVFDSLMEVATSAPSAPALMPTVAPPTVATTTETAIPALDSTVTTIVDEELREIYHTTSEERLQRLEASLLHLEKHPGDHNILAILMREAHSLKGDSRSAGVESVEVLAHAVEDVLSSIQQQHLDLNSTVSDRLYQGLDAMRQLVWSTVTGESVNVNPGEIAQALREIVPFIPAIEETLPAQPADARLASKASTLTLAGTVTPQIETVRVHTRELDSLIAQAEDLAVTRIQMVQTSVQADQLLLLWEEWKTQQQSKLDASEPSYEDRLESLILELRSTVQGNNSKLERVAEELRTRVRKLQLQPLATLFQPLPRAVRDLAKQQSKTVDLILEGKETTADKRLLEGIQDSLMHLVRNAIDHGIELPEERVAIGKPPAATLRVKAYQTALSLIIEIADDGRGLDVEQIKRTAVKRGLHSPEELAAMSTSQIQRLILAPGFSTRTFITEISGRGVGLDVLRTQVEQLKGSVQIESIPGEGCTFRLQLSTALNTDNVVVVEAQGLMFAVPIEFLQVTLLASPDQLVTSEGRDMLLLDDAKIPVTTLADVLELTNSPVYSWVAPTRRMQSDRRACVVLKVGKEQAGFLVDRLVAQQEVVSKPLNPLLQRVRNVAAATTLGTGDICMILNPPDMLKSLQQNRIGASVPIRLPKQHKPVILLIEDSPPVRIQEKRLFEGAGYEVITATNGLEGYNKLKTRDFDAVVSDIEMPYLDGFSLVSKIRQDPDRDDLPIVLVTTLDSDEDRQRGADIGADAYILKGKFNQEALLGTLKSLIQRTAFAVASP